MLSGKITASLQGEASETVIRLVSLVKRKTNVDSEAFAVFRRDRLGPCVAGLQAQLGISRYVQTHRSAGSAEAERGFIEPRPGVGNSFDGIEEYWWRTAEACRKAIGEAHGPWAEIASLSHDWFCSRSSVSWLAVDYPQVAASLSRIVASPRSGRARLVFAIVPHVGADAESAQRYWLLQHGPLVRSFAAARGLLAYNQVHRVWDLAGDTESINRADATPVFIGHAEAWYTEARPDPGSDGVEAMSAAISDEQAFIDWSRSSVFVGKELTFVDRCWV